MTNAGNGMSDEWQGDIRKEIEWLFIFVIPTRRARTVRRNGFKKPWYTMKKGEEEEHKCGKKETQGGDPLPQENTKMLRLVLLSLLLGMLSRLPLLPDGRGLPKAEGGGYPGREEA